MANELGVRVSADDKFIHLNGQAIGIACNSTYATIMEFIGYLIFVWAKDKCESVPQRMADRMKRYWYTREQLDQFRMR